MDVIEQMLSRYPAAERRHAMREVMQEIALAGLQRAGFFERAAFYGGTCLRIFHGLPRFSEDLDFSLLQSQDDFSFVPWFKALIDEFAAFGFDVDITERKKVKQSAIVSAFVKEGTSIHDVVVAGQRALKIKLEVDTHPPLGFVTNEALLMQPYSFYVKCYALPDLYAGKMHAVLYRRWRSRIKGRDWFDFEWYVRRGETMHLAHFEERARQSGDWSGDALTAELFRALLRERIASLDVDSAKHDVQPFLRESGVLDIWSRDYFMALVDRMDIA